jgi:hypothetical protein
MYVRARKLLILNITVIISTPTSSRNKDIEYQRSLRNKRENHSTILGSLLYFDDLTGARRTEERKEVSFLTKGRSILQTTYIYWNQLW